MTIAVALTLYAGVLLYAAVAYFLGPLVPIATIALGFGLLIIPYLFMEWIATPVVAAVMGYQARWTISGALVFGLPLVVLFTAITPVVSSGNASMSVPVPWLSVFASNKAKVVPIILERLVWWVSLYLVALVTGRISRHIRPPIDESDS